MAIPEKWSSLKSTHAWQEFLGLLDTTIHTLLEESRDELEVLDAYRLVFRCIAVASEVVLDPDPRRPAFMRMDTPCRNVGGDNPDGEYDVTTIEGSRSYRIWGNTNDVTYFGFQVLGGTGMSPRHHVAYLKDSDLVVDEQGNFEFVLSTTDLEDGRQWLPITEEASAVVVRQYIGDRTSETLASYNIEPIDPDDHYREPTDDEVSAKIIATAWTMVKLSLLYRDIPDVLNIPNQMTTLSSAQAGAADTTPDNTYMIGVYELDVGEALVIDLALPNTRYWNFTVENYWHECLDYLHRPVSITSKRMKCQADGTVRLILSAEQPSQLEDADNWISTSFRRRGFMILRWLDTPTDVSEPSFKLITLK